MTTRTPSGFTLIETLVAVLLLTMTIILPYYAIQRSLTATFNSRDDLIASALAQEAVEYVRGVRDNNYLQGRTGTQWLFGLDGGTGERNCVSTSASPRYCTVDATRGSDTNLAIVECATAQCSTTPLYISSNGTYHQIASGTRTPFVRYIQLTAVAGDPNAVRVTATVMWVYRGTHTVTVSDILTNWI